MEEIIFTFLYPRLDTNVSTGINHLLKSPWCVHPKTGKICVPFDPERVDEFDPDTSPTLSQALDEYNIELKNNPEKMDTDDVLQAKIPCMEESLGIFNKFVKGLTRTYARKKAASSHQSMEI